MAPPSGEPKTKIKRKDDHYGTRPNADCGCELWLPHAGELLSARAHGKQNRPAQRQH